MKKVLVTGGSRGIGRACVEKFASEGCAVSFIYNNSEKSASELSKKTGAFAIKADISKPDEVEKAVALAASEMGGVDILVNNAGVALIELITDTANDDYRRLTDTNLGGMFFTCRECARYMIRSHSGRIVNIGSVWGRVGASCETLYSATKAATEGLTKALAKELGPSGICVNCIEPGVINTEMNAELDDETLTALCDETPIGRIAEPEEVAELIYTVATEKSGFLTGQIIGFDGGFGL